MVIKKSTNKCWQKPTQKIKTQKIIEKEKKLKHGWSEKKDVFYFESRLYSNLSFLSWDKEESILETGTIFFLFLPNYNRYAGNHNSLQRKWVRFLSWFPFQNVTGPQTHQRKMNLTMQEKPQTLKKTLCLINTNGEHFLHKMLCQMPKAICVL